MFCFRFLRGKIQFKHQRRTTTNGADAFITTTKTKLVAVGAALFVATCLFPPFTRIPAGHVGVQDFLGYVHAKALPSGVNFVNPFATIVKYSTRLQSITSECAVPSSEGINITLISTVMFRLDPQHAPEVYTQIGRNYDDVLIPLFRATTRQVTSGHPAKDLYSSTTRKQIEDKIAEELQTKLATKGIIIEATPLKDILLPERLTQAIEDVLREEQESQRMQFVLVKETHEAERKRIEARGIADFQQIVSEGITAETLRWKGIQATERLANSPNAKLVFIGGPDGLPVLMNHQIINSAIKSYRKESFEEANSS